MLPRAALTPYAVEEIYPDTLSDLNDQDAATAHKMSSAVVEWARQAVS